MEHATVYSVPVAIHVLKRLTIARVGQFAKLSHLSVTIAPTQFYFAGLAVNERTQDPQTTYEGENHESTISHSQRFRQTGVCDYGRRSGYIRRFLWQDTRRKRPRAF